MLRNNEFSYEFVHGTNSVKSYDSNQLPSNIPIEDTRSEGRCVLTRGNIIYIIIKLVQKYVFLKSNHLYNLTIC